MMVLFFAGPFVAFAAPDIYFSETPASSYEVYKGDTYSIAVTLSSFVEDTDVEFLITNPGGREESIETYTYTKNGEHVFSWDGKFSNSYTKPGVHTLRISGHERDGSDTNELVRIFTVTEESRLSNVSVPTSFAPLAGQKFAASFNLETAVAACLVLSVEGDIVATEGPIGNGEYTLIWDGQLSKKIIKNGAYAWRIYSDSGHCGLGLAETDDLATGTVNVVSKPGAVPTVQPQTQTSAQNFASGVSDNEEEESVATETATTAAQGSSNTRTVAWIVLGIAVAALAFTLGRRMKLPVA